VGVVAPGPEQFKEDVVKKRDLPYMPFYVGDWRKAPDIRALTLEQRALWFEMLCLMWESPRRGYLTIDGKTMIDDETLARMVGEHCFVITKILQVLAQRGVFSIEEGTQIVYCRRMVKDEQISVSRSVAGTNGMKSRYSKKKKPSVCYNKNTTKHITNADIDVDIETDIVNKDTLNSLIEQYCKERGIDKNNITGEYPRYAKSAKRIYISAGKNKETALSVIERGARYYTEKGLNWTFETIAKNYAEILAGERDPDADVK
jgi:hypothetical protein